MLTLIKKRTCNCRCGWLYDGPKKYPMVTANPNCGNDVGLIDCDWRSEADVFCTEEIAAGKPQSISRNRPHRNAPITFQQYTQPYTSVRISDELQKFEHSIKSISNEQNM